MARFEGPDFICIGMPRAGTGWLFDQLVEHPEFWMPPIKEIRYLDREVPQYKGSPRRLKRETRRAGAKGQRKPLSERDKAFLETAIAIHDEPMDLKRYASMFRFKDDLITGDVTPSYSALGEDVIKKIAAEMPQPKILLLMRDPVARTWSHLQRKFRVGRFDKGLMDDLEKFRAYIAKSKNIEGRSQPTKIVERWERAAPNMQFRHYFFDDLVKRSDWLRSEIVTYFGGDPAKLSGELAAEDNRKASAKKLAITPEVQKAIAELLAGELHACAKKFGGYANEWVKKYGV